MKTITYKNYIYQLLSKVLPSVFSIMSQILIVNFADTSVFAKYWVITIIWSSIYAIFAGGTDLYYQRLHDNSNYLSAMYYKFLAWIGVLVILIPTLLIYGFSILEIIIFNLAFLFMALTELMTVFFRVSNQDKYLIYQKSIQIIILVVLLFFFKPKTLLDYGYIFCFSWFTVFIITLLNIKILKLSNINMYYFLKIKNIKEILLIGISIFSSQVFGNMDFLVLEKLLGSDIGGSYKVSYMMGFSILPVFAAILTIYLSKISKKVKVNEVMIKHFKYLFLIFISYFILLSFFNGYIMEYIFYKIDPAFGWYSLSFVFSAFLNGVTILIGYTLIVYGHQKFIAQVCIFVAFLSFPLSYILILNFSIYGALISNGVVYLFILLCYLSKLRSVYVKTI